MKGLRLLAVFLVVLCSPSLVNGVTFDWSTITWTPGTLVNSYDIDPMNPGDDITISVSGNTESFFVGYPTITDDFEGGYGTGTQQLDVFVNHNQDTKQIVITVTFTYWFGVNALDFTLFDVDKDGTKFTDQIRNIHSNYGTGADTAVTATTSANNSVSGSGLSQVITGTGTSADTGTGSDSGNVTLGFGTNHLTQFTFTYGNDPAQTQNNPSQQGIGLYNITYNPRVPEMGTTFALGAACVAGIFLQCWRRRIRVTAPVPAAVSA
jgi:hypothetical protein